MTLSLLFLLMTASGTTLAQTSNSSTPTQASNSATENYALPIYDTAPLERQQQIAANQQGYVYAQSLLGNLSFFLTGKLGDALVATGVELFAQEADIFGSIIETEAQEVIAAVSKASNATQTSRTSGTEELSSFIALYANQWRSSNPDGVDPGAFTNFTQDLYFSMERLSVNPFSLSRISRNQTLPFKVADNITTTLTGKTLSNLQQEGRLFVVDYSSFVGLPRQPGRYAAASTAYFYIHPQTAEFLPLAIKTNEGADLIYTPLDSPNDWFLAKTLFESNEAVASDMFHLSATHAVANAVHEAALRTMADQHPLRGYLDLIMLRAYAVVVVGTKELFNPGGPFDQNFAFGSSVALAWNSQLYRNISGHFQANYFNRWFVDRGLVNCSYGPPLAHFPFYEDAAPIVDSIRTFVDAYVESFYPTDDLLSQDTELQAWIVEANGAAQVIDFPPAPLTSRTTLIDILTQMAYLTGPMHHSLNGGAYATSWHLPLHPVAHYQPLPTSKGINSVMPFLPNVTQAINQIALFLQFNRPGYRYEGLNLPALFSSPGFLNRTNNDTRNAATQFQTAMAKLSAASQAKGFDGNGLSQGMPFIWRTIDPMRLPYFLDV